MENQLESDSLPKTSLPGFKIYTSKGKRYCYHRKSGKPIDLIKYPFGSPKFHAKVASFDVPKSTKGTPFTLGQLIDQYKASTIEGFGELSTETQKQYNRTFLYLKPLWDDALVSIDPATIMLIRDTVAEERGRHAARICRAVLSVLFAWGIPRGFTKENPCRDIKNIKNKKGHRPNPPWPHETVVIVFHHARHMLPVLAVMYDTGLDLCDAVKLPNKLNENGSFKGYRQKTGKPYHVTLSSFTVDLLKKKDHSAITLCASSEGTPWKESGFKTMWGRLKTKLVEKGLIDRSITLKGLRHTFGRDMRELAGASKQDVSDGLANTIGGHYSAGADMSGQLDPLYKIMHEKRGRSGTQDV